MDKFIDASGRVLHGLVEISNDDYHAGPGISSSHLKTIAEQSPLHYWHKYLNPNREPDEPTEAMKLGTAIHAAILEPNLFESSYIITPPFNRRTKAGRAEYEDFLAENAGKSIITPDDREICLAIRDRVHSHPVAAGLLTGGKAEQSFYVIDEETGELIKCRFDYLPDSGAMALDVKSTTDASKEAFRKTIGNLFYDVSAAWYLDVLRQLYGRVPDHWIWLAVEPKPPYAIGIYFASQIVLARAHDAARKHFGRIVECKRRGLFPDYGEVVEPIEDLPPFFKR